MVATGFKFGLGAALAVVLVWGLLDLGRAYGACREVRVATGVWPDGLCASAFGWLMPSA